MLDICLFVYIGSAYLRNEGMLIVKHVRRQAGVSFHILERNNVSYTRKFNEHRIAARDLPYHDI